MSTTTKKGLAHRLYTGEVSYDFIGHTRRWYAISAVLIGISILALLIRGLTLGIEFRGGTDFSAPATVTSTTVGDVRAAVAETGVPEGSIVVQTLGSTGIRVQTPALNPQQVADVRAAIGKQVGIAPDQVPYSSIGASWGQQITQQGLVALVVFLVLVMLMIWAYFRNWKMSVAAIVALIHDLIITVGFYALVGFTVTPATLIGVLTILGYSLYDTVVVFDKVRENVRDLTHTNKTFSQAANHAVNQVLVRSINTTIIGVLPVAALLIGGSLVLHSGPLQDLGMALFVGMIAGAYSSIFIATPIVTSLAERSPEMKEHREHLEKRRARSAKRLAESDISVSVATVGEGGLSTAAESLERPVRRTQPQRSGSRASRTQKKK